MSMYPNIWIMPNIRMTMRRFMASSWPVILFHILDNPLREV
jgi:hypothetical protein